MKLYFAGAESHPTLLLQNDIKKWLIAYPNTRIIDKYKNEVDIFLDSGAFSAHTKGKKISHKDYMEYVVESGLNHYASLDIIGNAKESKMNILTELENGLNPIPCFHYNEPFEYLEWYCQNFKLLGIGGIAQLKTQRGKLKGFINQCFSVIKKYLPIKIHGYGISSNLHQIFPFFSADSTGWLSATRHRTVANFSKGKIYYTESVRKKGASINDGNILTTDLTDERLLTRSCEAYKQFENYITELWAKRGVNWDE
jgi:hypothetical protein